MKQLNKSLLLIGILPLAIIQLAAILAAMLWFHTSLSLEIAKREGVYVTPEDGMRVLVTESWIDLEKIEMRAGSRS
jgi:hypothetical protein